MTACPVYSHPTRAEYQRGYSIGYEQGYTDGHQDGARDSFARHLWFALCIGIIIGGALACAVIILKAP